MDQSTPLAVPSEFRDSYLRFRSYPLGLMQSSADDKYDEVLLDSYRARLLKRQLGNRPLFMKPPPDSPPSADSHHGSGQNRSSNNMLLVRDISRDGKVTSASLRTDQQIKDYIGDKTISGKENPVLSLIKADPSCRFIFLPCSGMNGNLQLEEHMLLRLLSYHQVMPDYLDFLLIYGTKFTKDREIRYSGFKTSMVDTSPYTGNIIKSLGRSGFQYQICYNIKNATELEKDGSTIWKWKHRQTAIHHQFDIDTGHQLWIVADPHSSLASNERIARTFETSQVILSTRVKSLFLDDIKHTSDFKTHSQAFRSSLRMHLVFIRAYAKDWTLLIARIEEYLTAETETYLTSHDPRDKGHQVTNQHLSRLQDLERRISNVLVVLESNEGVFKLLNNFYSKQVDKILDRAQETDIKTCRESLSHFTWQVEGLINETQMHIKHVKLLLQTCYSMRELLIKHLEAQSLAKQEDFNASLWVFHFNGAINAIAMRIITVLTVIYLPATFVSIFFTVGIYDYVSAADTYNSEGLTAASTNPANTMTTGSVEFRQALFDKWRDFVLYFTFITLGLAVIWFLSELYFVNKKQNVLKKRWPDLYARFKEFS